MLRSRLSVALLCAMGSVFALHGCNTTPVDQTAGWSPNQLYSEATDERYSGAF